LVQDCLEELARCHAFDLAEVLATTLGGLGRHRDIKSEPIYLSPCVFRPLVGAIHDPGILEALIPVDVLEDDREEWLSVCEALGTPVRGPWWGNYPLKLSHWIEAELAANNGRQGQIPFLAGYMPHSKELGSRLAGVSLIG